MRIAVLAAITFLISGCGPLHVDASISFGDGISSKKEVNIEKKDEDSFAPVLPGNPS